MSRIVIAGYHGFGNTGDEAILQATLGEFRRVAPELDFTVLSSNPSLTAAAYQVRSILRTDLSAIVGELRGSDMFILGGGSLLQDVTSTRSLLYYLALLWCGKRFAGKAMIFANGIGPINTPLGRFLSREVLESVDLITLRDRHSADVLKELGVSRRPTVTADPAFLLEPQPCEELFERERIPRHHGPRVAVTVRSFRSSPHFLPEMARALDYIIERFHAQVVLFPMHRSMDLGPSRDLISLMRQPGYAVEGQYSPGQILYMLSRCQAILGTRLHSLILGVTAGVPTAGIIYDPKVESFLHELGCPCAGSVWDLQARDVVSAVEELLSRAAPIRALLDRARNRLVPLARQNVQMALDLLQGRFQGR